MTQNKFIKRTILKSTNRTLNCKAVDVSADRSEELHGVVRMNGSINYNGNRYGNVKGLFLEFCTKPKREKICVTDHYFYGTRNMIDGNYQQGRGFEGDFESYRVTDIEGMCVGSVKGSEPVYNLPLEEMGFSPVKLGTVRKLIACVEADLSEIVANLQKETYPVSTVEEKSDLLSRIKTLPPFIRRAVLQNGEVFSLVEHDSNQDKRVYFERIKPLIYTPMGGQPPKRK